MAAPVKAQVYWDSDQGSSNIYLEQGMVTTDPTGMDPTQAAFYSDYFSPGSFGNPPLDYDLIFSAGTVGTEAQTILLDNTYDTDTGEYGIGGLIFDKGSITLQDDGTKGSSFFIEQDGIVLGANAGTTTLDPNLLVLDQDQSWENDSTSDLIVASTVEGGRSFDDLTIDGKGTGAVRITGQISSSVRIIQDSLTSTLYLANSNPGLLSLAINGGAVVAANESSIASLPVTITDGGTLSFQSTLTFANPVTITGGGTLNFTGDTPLKWASGAVNADTLTIGSGDALDETPAGNTENIGTLDLVNTTGVISTQNRLIVSASNQGYGFLNSIGTVNVGANYILDFGHFSATAGTVATVNNVINVANGGAIESRDNGTVVFGQNLSLPTTGVFNSGGDDTGQGTLDYAGNYTIGSAGLTLVLQGAANSPAVTEFGGNLGGTGLLTVEGVGGTTSPANASIMTLTGPNTFSGGLFLPLVVTGKNASNQNLYASAPIVYILGNESGIGSNFTLQVGSLIFDKAGTLPGNAVVTIAGSTFHTYFQIGDGNGAANAVVAGISTTGSTNNGADNIIGGSSSMSTLTLDPSAGQIFVYNGTLGGSGANNTNLALVKNGAGVQYLGNIADNYTGGTVINQGILEVITGGTAAQNVLGTGLITINNGAVLAVINSGGFPGAVTLGAQGTVTYSGDSYQAGGTLEGLVAGTTTGNDYTFSGTFSGGTNLVLGTGDDIDKTAAVGSVGNLYIVGGRLLMANTNLVNSASSVLVADGGIMDFNGITANLSSTLPIEVGANGWINERSSTVTINDLQLVTGTSGNSSSLVIGTDDSAGQTGSITVTNQVALNGNFSVIGSEAGTNKAGNNPFTAVNFSGGFTGTGNLNVSSLYLVTTGGNAATLNRGLIVDSGTNNYKGDTTVSSGIFDLHGDSTGVTAAGGLAPNYLVTGTVPATSVYNPGILQVGPGGSLGNTAKVTIGTAGTSNNFAYFAIGDNTGAGSVTVGSITAGASNSAIINGDSHDATAGSLTVNVAAGTTDTYIGAIGSDPNNYTFTGQTAEAIGKFNNVANLNNLSLTKSGTGTLVLSGTNSYTGATTVNAGKLAVNSSTPGGVTVNAGGELGGSGKINGTIVGAGAVGPGNSPGILSATQVNPTTGMSFNFEFTLTGLPPTFSSASASGNDILHLEGATPFTAALTSANDINLYFSGVGSFEGGFFTNGPANNLTTNIASATYDFYVEDNANGAVTYNGNRYDLSSGTESVIAAASAGFADGTVSGFTEEFTVNAPLAIPEPSTYMLMGIGGLAFLVLRRRLKA